MWPVGPFPLLGEDETGGLAVILVFALLAETSPPWREPTLTQKGLVGVPRVHLGRGSGVWPFETKGATPIPFPKSPHSHYGPKRSPAVGLGSGLGEPLTPKRPLLAVSPWQMLLGSELSSGC